MREAHGSPLPERAVRLLERRLDALPAAWKERLLEQVLLTIPLRVLERIPCSYANYIKSYRPRPGDVVIDCGAHVGLCSVLFARLVGPIGRVIALEPFPDSFARLQRRISRLGLRQVTALPLGVWRHPGTLAFRAMNDSVENSVVFVGDGAEEGALAVQVDTLDAIAARLGLVRVDLVKMDIEGAEIEALDGAEGLVEGLSPRFAIASYHLRDGVQTRAAIAKRLRGWGYTTVEHDPHHTTCGVGRGLS